MHNLIQVRWPALQRHGQKLPKKKQEKKSKLSKRFSRKARKLIEFFEIIKKYLN